MTHHNLLTNIKMPALPMDVLGPRSELPNDVQLVSSIMTEYILHPRQLTINVDNGDQVARRTAAHLCVDCVLGRACGCRCHDDPTGRLDCQ